MGQAQAYPDLSRIGDPVVAQSLRLLWDRIHAQEGRDGDPIVLRANLDANGFKLTNLSTPTDDDDAATKEYVDDNSDAEAIRTELEGGGNYPLNVQNLRGVLADPQKMGIRVIPDEESLPNIELGLPNEVILHKGILYYFDDTVNPGRWTVLSTAASILADTHANRLANHDPDAQPLNLLFWETDWKVLYRIVDILGTRTWQIVENIGYMRDTFANRPVAAVLAADTESNYEGMRFRATDRGEQLWRFDDNVTNTWILVPGYGEPMQGTLSPDQKPVLAAADTGFRFFSTDFNREFVWGGAAWADAPSAPARYEIGFFAVAPEPITGWVLCNGAASTRSTSVGGTAAYTVPSLTGSNYFLRSAAAAGGTGGGATHQHGAGTLSGDATTTGGPDDDVDVQADGTTVASDTHQHSVPSHGVSGNTANASSLPPYYNALPYIRL